MMACDVSPVAMFLDGGGAESIRMLHVQRFPFQLVGWSVVQGRVMVGDS